MSKKDITLAHNFSGITPECGCDEAGRGCLAGPVVAAAVILPEEFFCPELNDSKQMTESVRNKVRLIIEQKALAWSVGFVDNYEIDKINILNASILAMHRAIEGLKIQPSYIIVDGNKFKSYQQIPHQTIVKGDGKYLSIAAASVLAKTYRDEYMIQLSADFPEYEWNQNKAYPTLAHRNAIRKNGITAFHRISFDLLGDKKKIQVKKSVKRKRSGVADKEIAGLFDSE